LYTLSRQLRPILAPLGRLAPGPMLRATFLTGFAAAVLACAPPALAQNSPAAQRVFDRARTASGGAAAWNKVMGITEAGTEAGKPYKRQVDPIRYGYRVETETPKGHLVQGYNGAGEWRILPSGAETGSIEREVLNRIRSETFFSGFYYFFPSRFDLKSDVVGTRQAGGKSFDVVRVQPAGGEPRELWFDRKTGLPAQMVETTGASPLRIEYGDWRKAGAVRFPHHQTATGGGLSAPRERVVQTVSFETVDRDLFSLPRKASQRLEEAEAPVKKPKPRKPARRKGG
jgi:hypothetical protein